MTDIELSNVVRNLVAMLVADDYLGLENLTRGNRLPATEIEQAVKDYGAKLIMPPNNTFNNLDIIEIENVHPRKWSVRFDLWANDEGQSDLALELTLTELDNRYDVQIDNIHVL